MIVPSALTAPVAWQRSSFSGGGGANCLELARHGEGGLLLRESDVPRSVMGTSARRLAALLRGVKTGRFDRLAPHPAG